MEHTASAGIGLAHHAGAESPPSHPSAAAPAGTLRATTTMRAALPLKATNARGAREERARAKALRAQIDELKGEMAVASAEAEGGWRRNGSGRTG